MQRLKAKLLRLAKHLASYLPSQLPVGLTEFEAWAQDIMSMASPLPNNASIRWVLATMIQRLDSARDRVPKRYFVRALLRAAAGEVAHNVMVDLKEKQQAAAKAALEAASGPQQSPVQIVKS